MSRWCYKNNKWNLYAVEKNKKIEIHFSIIIRMHTVLTSTRNASIVRCSLVFFLLRDSTKSLASVIDYRSNFEWHSNKFITAVTSCCVNETTNLLRSKWHFKRRSLDKNCPMSASSQYQASCRTANCLEGSMPCHLCYQIQRRHMVLFDR